MNDIPSIGGCRGLMQAAVAAYTNELMREDENCRQAHEQVLSVMENALLRTVMLHVNYNQTKAAVALGINRGTLRKKLKEHGILN